MSYWKYSRESTCCFTGHRPDKLPSGYSQNKSADLPLRAALRDSIQQAVSNGYQTFLSGMALGIDTWAAEEILSLKETGNPVQLIAVLPCPHQDSRWRYADRCHYRELLKRADEIHTICESYTPYCMGARNLWMVDHSSLVLSIFDGSPGGTANTLAHAERLGIPVVLIPLSKYY